MRSASFSLPLWPQSSRWSSASAAPLRWSASRSSGWCTPLRSSWWPRSPDRSYRLYEIDVVINKTLVYALLAAFITAVYVAIVVGIGQAIGSKRNLGLSILATAVVAVGFQPVRDRVQHLANRLVYGKRATPYEVLSEFSERMSGTYAA